MTNSTQISNYPTPTDIFNKLIELSNQNHFHNDEIFEATKKKFDSVGISYNEDSLFNVIQEDVEDIDEIVYDAISEWDEKFEGDTDWCDEDDSDEKDYLRDFVMNIIEQEEATLLDINEEFLKRDSVQKELKNFN